MKFIENPDGPVLATAPIPVQSLHQLDPIVTPDLTKELPSSQKSSPQHSQSSPKMNSLDRKSMTSSANNSRMSSLERQSKSSLERQSKFSSLERQSAGGVYRRGSCSKQNSLERSRGGYSESNSLERSRGCGDIPSRVYPQFQDAQQQVEENIYDFGGVNVKSCAYQVKSNQQLIAQALMAHSAKFVPQQHFSVVSSRLKGAGNQVGEMHLST